MIRSIVLSIVPAIALAGSVPPRNSDELRTALQSVLSRYQVPGAGIAIVTANRIIWAGGVGKADLTGDRDVTADTQFRLGSISKSFVALALVKLQEEGRIDLDATLDSVAPEVAAPNPWRATHPVRIAHVLEHTAGFDEARFAQDYLAPGEPAPLLLDILRRFPGPQRVRWPPGTRFAYSNAGYVTAGYLIEKIAGRPYDDLIREKILLPLGMERSGFRLTDSTRRLLAQGYNHRPPRAVPYRSSAIAPAGDLMSSPTEFACFLQWLVRRELKTLDRVERGRTSLAAQAGIASYGLGNYPWAGAWRRQGHSGMIEGFRSAYFYLPEAGIGYVVMTNSSAPGGATTELYRIVHEFAAGDVPKQRQPAAFDGPITLERFAGVYVPADYRSQIAAFSEAFPRARRVTVKDGALHISGLLGEGRRKLVPVSANTFRGAEDTEPTIAFPAEGILTGRAGYFERVPGWQPYAYAGTVVVALLVMASSILYAFVWIWRRRTLDRVLPLAAVLCLVVAGLLVAAFVEDMSVLGRVNFRTVGYVLFTWLFVGFSFTGAAVALRRRPARVYALLVSLSCWIFALALADWGLLGVRLWRH